MILPILLMQCILQILGNSYFFNKHCEKINIFFLTSGEKQKKQSLCKLSSTSPNFRIIVRNFPLLRYRENQTIQLSGMPDCQIWYLSISFIKIVENNYVRLDRYQLYHLSLNKILVDCGRTCQYKLLSLDLVNTNSAHNSICWYKS